MNKKEYRIKYFGFLIFTILSIFASTFFMATSGFSEEKNIESQGTIGFFGEYRDSGPDPKPDSGIEEFNNQGIAREVSNNNESLGILPKTGELTNHYVLWGLIILFVVVIYVLKVKRKEEDKT